MPKKNLEIGRNDPQVKVSERADEYCKIGPPKSRTSYRTLALSPAIEAQETLERGKPMVGRGFGTAASPKPGA